MKTLQVKEQAAFSMVQLSISLLIVGVLAVGAVQYLRSGADQVRQTAQDHRKSTDQLLLKRTIERDLDRVVGFHPACEAQGPNSFNSQSFQDCNDVILPAGWIPLPGRDFRYLEGRDLVPPTELALGSPPNGPSDALRLVVWSDESASNLDACQLSPVMTTNPISQDADGTDSNTTSYIWVNADCAATAGDFFAISQANGWSHVFMVSETQVYDDINVFNSDLGARSLPGVSEVNLPAGEELSLREIVVGGSDGYEGAAGLQFTWNTGLGLNWMGFRFASQPLLRRVHLVDYAFSGGTLKRREIRNVPPSDAEGASKAPWEVVATGLERFQIEMAQEDAQGNPVVQRYLMSGRVLTDIENLRIRTAQDEVHSFHLKDPNKLL
ncbi:MAG: hypothetical protein EA369_00625 [Bradymonadales bacterium]|nr:MAG: hypothetical protein EA369_00625 [Bradymonadales bacterium]